MIAKDKEQFSPYLFEFIKKNVDFASFLENEVGSRISWVERGSVGKIACPIHTETKASFHIKLMADEHVWIYNCFGCNSHGTVIDFCMDYYDYTAAETVAFLCKKYGFKAKDISITDNLKDVKKTINLQKKVECAHIVSANQCRILLKKDYFKYNKWVAESYKRMNKALDEDDLETIELTGFEAANKMKEKQCP